ncbi:MAG TPA: hypothetical protein VLX68_16070 [Chitinivibrionales bacterium]|nr:hypothetical protein [Chitinivibrionales bacterium]
MRLIFINILLFTIIAFFSVSAEEPCLKNAWSSFGKKDYKTAITYCDTCIKKFGKISLDQQAKLEKDSVPLPPAGKVDNEAEKNKIFSQGLINDVATSFWIKGESAEHLYETSKDKKYKNLSQEAFKGAVELNYGRCWDPKGWFWSPGDAAKKKLTAK